MVIDLINNVALLLAVCWLQSLVSNSIREGSLKAQISSGIVFGAATIIVMMTSILIQPGLWLWTDSGTVVVGVSTLLYGPIAGGMSLAAGVAYKLWIGGAASTGGVVNLVISFVAGILLRILARKFKFHMGGFQFLLFGLAVHVVATWQLYHFHIPVDSAVAMEFYLTLLAIMSPATAILGQQLQYIERKVSLERQIKESEKRLSLITQSIPDQLILANKEGVLTDAFTPGDVAKSLNGRANKSLAAVDEDAFENHYAYLISKALTSGESVTDTYSSNRQHLLDDRRVETEHHFESTSRPVEGYNDEEVVILTRDITRRVNAEREIAFLAYYDPLTKLPNAYKALAVLEDYVAKYSELKKHFFVTMLHLDNFYLFNESLGKEAGDAVLREIGEKLRDALEEDHFLARFSGVEFLIISPNAGRPEDLIKLFRKLRLEISVPLNGQQVDMKVAVSGGVCRFPQDGADHQELIRKASLALDAAVGSSSRVRFYHPTLDEELHQLLTVRNDIINVVKDNKLYLHYEPVFSLKDSAVQGLEVIVRCDDPRFDNKAPDFLMDAAERSGLMLSMIAWVLETACFAAKELEKTSGFVGDLFIKMSPFELTDPEFPFLLQSVLSRTQFSPGRLFIDITEASTNKPIRGIRKALEEIDKIGVGLKVDIFSSSYGALASLERTHSAKLKISSQLAIGDSMDGDNHKTITSILSLAKSMQVDTLVEDVNDQFTDELIKSIGFDAAQGSYYCEPVSLEDIKAKLQSASQPKSN